MLNLSGPVGEDFFKAIEKMRSEAFSVEEMEQKRIEGARMARSP